VARRVRNRCGPSLPETAGVARTGHATPALVVRDLVKRYGSTLALAGLDLSIRRNTVTAVIGANGSGKSTLLKVVSGLVSPSSGHVYGPTGEPVRRLADAHRLGVALVPQEPTLAGHLTVSENVALGRREATRGVFLDSHKARRFAESVCAGLLPLEWLDTPVATLNKSSRQLVQLAAAVARRPAVLMLDEPTAVLDEAGVRILHALVRRFVDDGGTVVLVSHRLRDVLDLAEHVVVLRNGMLGYAGPVTEETERQIVDLLSAEEPDNRPSHRPDASTVVLEARDLHGWQDLRVERFVVHRGEIVGIAGQSGSGRSRLASILSGAYPASGSVRIHGRELAMGNIRAAQRAGVSYIPEDRQNTAILGNQTVATNVLVGRGERSLRRGLFRHRNAERAMTRQVIERFQIQPADTEYMAALLSGGNQQKLVVGRALSRGGTVLVADEPTQGVDAAARGAIHATLLAAAARGAAIVAVFSEFEELFEISDRIVVLCDGRIVLDRPRGDINAADILAASLGAHGARPGHDRTPEEQPS
jgi:ABC-type sugar transport system ATPase subunit